MAKIFDDIQLDVIFLRVLRTYNCEPGYNKITDTNYLRPRETGSYFIFYTIARFAYTWPFMLISCLARLLPICRRSVLNRRSRLSTCLENRSDKLMIISVRDSFPLISKFPSLIIPRGSRKKPPTSIYYSCINEPSKIGKWSRYIHKDNINSNVHSIVFDSRLM